MKLTVEDIADLRAYEREREEFLRYIIALKKRRRVGLGPFITLLFENRDTIRFQIQEMARAEKILSDDGIQTELDIYNPLIPEPGFLCATLFVELTTEEELRTWLPRLVGIEQAVELRLPGGGSIAAVPEGAHADQLTRDTVTASVHYIRFSLTPEEIDAVAGGDIRLASAHSNYAYETELDESTLGELLSDLRGR